MTTRSCVTPRLACIGAAAILLGGCDMTVSTDDVEAQARTALSGQIAIDSVDCPEALPGEVGARITCTLISEGTPHDLVVVVTEVDGSQVGFEMEVQPKGGAPATQPAPGAPPASGPAPSAPEPATATPAVDPREVEAQSTQVFSQQFQVDSVSCDQGLPAQVGAQITCVLVSEGKPFEMTVTTTEVSGDNVDFDLELTKEL